MKIFDKNSSIVSKVLFLGQKLLSAVLSLLTPEKELVQKLEKMDLEDMNKLIRRAPSFRNTTNARDLSKNNSGKNIYENMQAIFAYSDPLAKQMVWEIKYRKNLVLADKIGFLIYREMIAVAKNIGDNGNRKDSLGTIGAPDVPISVGTPKEIIVAPIPASKQRKRERGFNQCEIICQAIMKCAVMKNNLAHGENLGEIFLYEPNLLAKIKNTPHQADLTREKRLKNISGSFAIPFPEKIHGKIIFIVDDVITTGKTMFEAKKILESAGAKKVYCFAIAH